MFASFARMVAGYLLPRKPTTPPAPMPPPNSPSYILTHTNWSDPTSNITPHFTVKEATYLPSWGIYHTPSDAERAALLQLCVVMEKIRAYLNNRSINVHCMIRPTRVNCPTSPHNFGDYNAAVGSTAKHSAHIMGMACDFDVVGMNCDDVREALRLVLDEFNIRMENAPGTSWVHIDTYSPSVSGGQRYFKP